MEHCADHRLPEILRDTHHRLRRAGTVASQTPVVAADLYWSIGALAQCLTAMDEVISQLGINARKQLRAGKFDVQSGPFEGEPDAPYSPQFLRSPEHRVVANRFRRQSATLRSR